jgi:hypothetical protein
MQRREGSLPCVPLQSTQGKISGASQGNHGRETWRLEGVGESSRWNGGRGDSDFKLRTSNPKTFGGSGGRTLWGCRSAEEAFLQVRLEANLWTLNIERSSDLTLYYSIWPKAIGTCSFLRREFLGPLQVADKGLRARDECSYLLISLWVLLSPIW